MAQLAIISCSVGSAGICLADAEEQAQEIGSFGNTSVFWMLMKVIGFLIIIIGIFLVIMKIAAQKNRGFHSGRSIKTLGGLGLGPNKSVQVVQIGRSLFVLGVGNDVELLGKIDDPEEIEFIESRIHPNGPGELQGFPTMKEWLKRISARKPSPSEDLDMNHPSFQAVFQEKMHRLASRQKKVDEWMGHENQDERLNDKP